MLVDIHNHILPGLDDGPKSMDEAILLAKNAVANGITHIIATPHHHNGKYINASAVIKEAVVSLNAQLLIEDIPVEILPGQEVYLYNHILDDLEVDVLTLADSGKYILVELPDNYLPTSIFDILFKIQLKGYTPIIAHPERNVALRKDKQVIYELIDKGALFQLTASTLVGVQGRTMKKYASDLIKNNLVHFISSDAHHLVKRAFLLKEAYSYIGRKFPENHVRYFKENAEHVVFGTDIQPMPPINNRRIHYL